MVTMAAPSDYWLSFMEECDNKLDIHPLLDTDLKTSEEEILKSLERGGGLSIDSLKTLTTYAFRSNKEIVDALVTFREDITKKKGESEKMKGRNKEIVNVLGDEYMEMSSQMIDFFSEMKKFLTLAQDSHSYVAHEIQQYFEMEPDKRDAGYYKSISEELEKLKRSDNVYELSAEKLNQRAMDLKSHFEKMLQKLKVEIKKLAKKEQSTRFWKKIASITFAGALFCLVAVRIVVALVPYAKNAMNTIIEAVGSARARTVSRLDKSEMNYRNMREANESRREETRVAIKELGDIKSYLDDTIGMIDSLLYRPNSAMDPKQIDYRMKEIRGKLDTFWKEIETLQEAVEKCKKEIRKARADVHII